MHIQLSIRCITSALTVEIITDKCSPPVAQHSQRFRIESLVQGNVRTETLSLDGFPKRAEYSMRLQLETLFLDEKTCRISVRDAGFGDFFPATDFHAEKTIHLGGNDGKFNSLS